MKQNNSISDFLKEKCMKPHEFSCLRDNNRVPSLAKLITKIHLLFWEPDDGL